MSEEVLVTTTRVDEPSIEILRIESDGRLFWRQREVETDDELRAAMMDLRNHLVNSGIAKNA